MYKQNVTYVQYVRIYSTYRRIQLDMYVSLYTAECYTDMQWKLRIKDTLGLLYLSFVERLSSLGGSKCFRTIERRYIF